MELLRSIVTREFRDVLARDELTRTCCEFLP
jgi:hypothetical protein